MEAGQECAQHVADVDQQVVDEPPADETVEQAGEEAPLENRREAAGLQCDRQQAPGDKLPVQPACPSLDCTNDAPRTGGGEGE